MGLVQNACDGYSRRGGSIRRRGSHHFVLSASRSDDDGQIKHHWLWTTIRDDTAPYEYDSFRVFTYVLKRHRYETAYIERNIEGYYPSEAVAGATPKFSLILRGVDGKLYRKTWIMEGYMVRKVADEPYQPKASDAPESKSDGITDNYAACWTAASYSSTRSIARNSRMCGCPALSISATGPK